MKISADTPPEEIKKIFKSRDVKDYGNYAEEDYEPSLEHTIKTLIEATPAYIVYLDENSDVEWAYTESFDEVDDFLNDFGIILTKIAVLEELSKNKLKGNNLQSFRRLLGESVARLLDGGNRKDALQNLTQAEKLLNEKNSSLLIISALKTVTILIGVEFLIWLNHQWFHFVQLPEMPYSVIICSLAGGIGAFIFLMLRSKSLDIEPTIEEKTYIWEGRLRIFYGVLVGLVTYLAVTTGFLFAHLPHSRDFILFICLISGSSERILPGMIKKIDDQIKL